MPPISVLIRRGLLPLASGLCLVFSVASVQVLSGPLSTEVDSVDLKRIDYKDLCAAVRALRGRVIVVNVWAVY
jgi:hypothetical protein